jgi:ketopantoate reductase
MKILIVGAGMIGVTYGWALSEAGQDVTHFVRSGRKEQLKEGVTLDLIDDRKRHPKTNMAKYALKCVENILPSDHYELIILPLHFYQVEAALQTLIPVSGDAIFLDLGSNWNGTETIEKLIPKERYLLGFPYGGGTIENGTYVTYLGPKVYVGEVNGVPTEKLERVKSFFTQADIQTDVSDNILHLLWTSHVGAVAFSAGIVRSQGVIPFLHDKAAMTQSYYVVKELYELCRLRGVDPYRYMDQAFLFKLPLWLFMPVLRMFCTYNAGVVRVFSHIAEPERDARELYIAMLNTAQELKFDLPRTKATESYLMQ